MNLRTINILSLLFFLLLSSHVLAQKQENNDSVQRITELNELAYDVLRTDPAQSLEYSQLALNISRQTGYAEGQINSLLLSGMVFKNIGAFDKSADAYFQALRIAESEKNNVKISSCLNNIGNIYQAQNNFEKALYYYGRSLDIEEDLNNKPQISIRLYNIGALYESVDSLDRALTYYYNSLMIEEETKNSEGILYALYGIAGVETRLKRFESAQGNLKRALGVARSMDDYSGLALCYHELGKLHIAQSMYSEAVSALDSGVFFARSVQMRSELMLIYKDLAVSYRALGKNDLAFEYLNSYVDMKDTINSIEITGKVAELETRFQVEKKQEEIQYLKDLNSVKTEKAESEKRNRNFLLVTIIMIIILSAFNLQRIAPDTRTVILFSLMTGGVLLLLSVIVSLFYMPVTWPIYFRSLRDVVTYSMPFLFTGVFLAERILMKKYLESAKDYTRQLQEIKPEISEKLVDFHFEGKDAEIRIQLKDLLCIEANDNYIAIYYLNNNTVKKELFRSTMKMAEDQLVGNDEIIRCHKSYIINTSNVHHVSGNAQGYRLHLNNLEFAIPVSRSFPRSMIEKIRKQA